jgi:hypothetical protein
MYRAAVHRQAVGASFAVEFTTFYKSGWVCVSCSVSSVPSVVETSNHRGHRESTELTTISGKPAAGSSELIAETAEVIDHEPRFIVVTQNRITHASGPPRV